MFGALPALKLNIWLTFEKHGETDASDSFLEKDFILLDWVSAVTLGLPMG